MNENQDLLDHAVALFPPPEGSYGRLVRRRTTRRHTQRLSTAALALVVAATAIGIAVRAFHAGGGRTIPTNPTPTNPAGVVATVPVGHRPAAVAYGEGAVWVANAGDGTVSRVDPATNQVVATIDVGKGRYLEMAAGEGGVWVGNPAGTLSRIDPATNRVVATIQVPWTSEVATGAGAVWVSDYEHGTVSKVDPGTNQVVATISVSGSDPHGLAVAGGYLWVLVDNEGNLEQVDPSTDRVVAAIPGMSPGVLAAGAGSVWAVASDYSVLRIDPATRSITTIGPVWHSDSPNQLDIAATDDAVWILTPDSSIRVDPKTNQVMETIPAGGYANAVGDGSAWVIDQEHDTLVRVNPGAAETPTGIPSPAFTGGQPSPSATPPTRPNGLVVAESDSRTLHDGYAVNLDAGDPGDPGADVTWIAGELQPANGSFLASIIPGTGTGGGKAPDFDRLRVLDLRSYLYSPQPLDGTSGPGNQLAVGDVFGIWTAKGNYSKAEVLGRSGADLEIRWVTYSFSSTNPCGFSGITSTGGTDATGAPIVARGSELTLCGVLTFDFDSGTTMDGTPDIWWEQETQTVRNINTSVGGLGLVNLGEVDFDSLSAADLKVLAYDVQRIDGSDTSSNRLVDGDVFAVHTSDGNYAKVQVLTYGYNLELRYVTYPG